jgi:hypothetical protein
MFGYTGDSNPQTGRKHSTCTSVASLHKMIKIQKKKEMLPQILDKNQRLYLTIIPED